MGWLGFSYLLCSSLILLNLFQTNFPVYHKTPYGKTKNLLKTKFVIALPCQNLWIVAKFASSVIIAICQDAPFWHLFSQLFKNFCQTFDNFLANLSLFVVSFEYLAKPLMNFWHTRHFCEICLYRLNLPFSYNRYLQKVPVFLILI